MEHDSRNISINAVAWRERTRGTLERNALLTLGSIADLSVEEMRRIPGVGKVMLDEIRAVLALSGLTFRDPVKLRYEAEYAAVAVEFNKQQRAYVAAIFTLTGRLDELKNQIGHLHNKLDRILKEISNGKSPTPPIPGHPDRADHRQ